MCLPNIYCYQSFTCKIHSIFDSGNSPCVFLAWKIPWTVEPGRPQTMGLQRVGHDWAHKHALIRYYYMSDYFKFRCFFKPVLPSEPYFHLVIQSKAWKITLIILSGRNKLSKMCLLIMTYSNLIPYFSDNQLACS